MRKLSRLSIALVLSLVLAAAPAAAQDAGGDNAAVAINTKDGSSIFKLAFKVHRTMSDVVDQTNAAVAYASCESCQTVAAAIQVVLIMSDPSVVSPTNVAIAVNESCTLCNTLASAYQYVITTGGPVHFDAEGNQEIAEIRRALIELSKQTDLTIGQIQAEVDELVGELYAVVQENLVSAGAAGDIDDGVETDEPTTGVTAPPTTVPPTATEAPRTDTPLPEVSSPAPSPSR